MDSGIRFNKSGIVLSGGEGFCISGDLPLAPKELTILTGDNGVGKTITLHAVATVLGFPGLGLVANVSDATVLLMTETPEWAGMVRQEPYDNFVSRCSADEFLLPLVNSGISRKKSTKLLEELTRRLDMDPNIYGQPIQKLSGGETQMLALAAALVPCPTVLLLDEPVARLDHLRRDIFMNTLAELATEHEVAVLATSHRPHDMEETTSLPTTVLLVERQDRQIHLSQAESESAPSITLAELPFLDESVARTESVTHALNTPPIHHVEFVPANGRRWLGEDSSFSVRLGRRGRIIARAPRCDIREGLNLIIGANGSGKSTAGRVLAGLIPFERWWPRYLRPISDGTVTFEGENLADTFVGVRRLGQSVYLPTEPDRWLSSQHVSEELGQFGTYEQARSLLGSIDVCPEDSIDTLSYGQKRALCLASLPDEIALVVLDEPFVGLARAIALSIASTIFDRLNRRTWRYVVVASKDPQLTLSILGEAVESAAR